MFRKFLILGVIIAFMFICFGCASIQKGSSFNGLTITDQSGKSNVGHYNARNWGIYVIKWGLITGDTSRPNQLFNISFLNDNVNVDKVGEMLTASAKKDGATAVEDLVSARSSMYFFPVFFFKTASMSGNGVK